MSCVISPPPPDWVGAAAIRHCHHQREVNRAVEHKTRPSVCVNCCHNPPPLPAAGTRCANGATHTYTQQLYYFRTPLSAERGAHHSTVYTGAGAFPPVEAIDTFRIQLFMAPRGRTLSRVCERELRLFFFLPLLRSKAAAVCVCEDYLLRVFGGEWQNFTPPSLPSLTLLLSSRNRRGKEEKMVPWRRRR